MLAQGYFKGQKSTTNHKLTPFFFFFFFFFFEVDAINMQSLSGHYLMRQQVPMVFLLLLVFLSAVDSNPKK